MTRLSRTFLSVLKSILVLPLRAWRKLPFLPRWKERVKHGLFSVFPFLFRRLEVYRKWQNRVALERWQQLGEPAVSAEVGLPDELSAKSEPIDLYVPPYQGELPAHLPVRLIAFYLPQFHAIPENDRWWGEGFTEWTNVRPATAMFEGHYQPHVPGDLGYYNLLDTEVQARQVALARLYGVGGFCFYTYWFNGKLLLEKPVENYLANRQLDLPFCLCWANENWTRRWDGLESEILVQQKHSHDDDLAFIRHVARFMRDDRYMRINDRPLLLVYRPKLLPSAIETAKRWRTWCRQEGIGEIYLAYTQSFELTDPAAYGFDAAVEFPPNDTQLPNVTARAKPRHPDFGNTLYDWRFLVWRSRNYSKPGYKLFRGVCPSWDNTARRKNKANIFVNSSPKGYREWLGNAVSDTCNRLRNPDERLVFVNAWNEWAEGAYLEPDQKYGYAYLEATRQALLDHAGRGQGERATDKPAARAEGVRS